MENQDCYHKVTEPKYECVLFDVDDTLYPLSSGIPVECTKNIVEYMINRLQIEKHKAPEMCALLYKDYGTTMAGLRGFVHGRLPYEWLKPDHRLMSLLHSLCYTPKLMLGPDLNKQRDASPRDSSQGRIWTQDSVE